MKVIFKELETEEELKRVLDLCYRILGSEHPEIYGYNAWLSRLQDGKQPLLYAECDGKVVSAVLGRYESADSLIIGMVVCDEEYRNRGITKKLIERFEARAKEMRFKYITLGSKEDAFYEKCGYRRISTDSDQSVYQKWL